jgi:AcrR family transcriptional regulator
LNTTTAEIVSNQAASVRKAKARLRRTEGIRSDALLKTALSLFAEEGYRDVTIQKIAKRLRIRHSLIYYYFDSKEKLFHSALLHALEKLMAAYGEVRKRHQHPVDLINDWFRVNVDLGRSGPHQHRDRSCKPRLREHPSRG